MIACYASWYDNTQQFGDIRMMDDYKYILNYAIHEIIYAWGLSHNRNTKGLNPKGRVCIDMVCQLCIFVLF